MATTIDRPRAKSAKPSGSGARRPAVTQRSPVRAAKPKAAKKSPVRAAKATAAKKAAGTALTPHSPGSGLARKAALAVLKRASRQLLPSGGVSTARQLMQSSGETANAATERMLDAAATSTSPTTRRRPPVQVAVDVAVPRTIAWQEWSELNWLPDGAGTLTNVRRGRGGRLRAALGRSRQRWAGEITEEREPESFAWRATRGTDCAGLITFHELSDCLTRIELSLEVRPLDARQALALTMRAADRRTVAQLSRFKAHLELISPDEYQDHDQD